MTTPAAGTPLTVEVRDLERWHPGAPSPTLRGISFAVPAGSLAAILGESGAGKTTLLRCLAGLDAFQRGTIAVEDVRVVAADGRPGRAAALERARLRGRVGLVFQTLELFPHRTVLENCVLAPMLVQRLTRGVAEARARDLLARLGLEDKADAYPQQLSGGQCQRAAIARALAMEPRVLLYDEPTSALDASRKDEVLDTLRRVRAAGVTQIIVTHDTALARAATDRVFVIRAGCLTAPAD